MSCGYYRLLVLVELLLWENGFLMTIKGGCGYGRTRRSPRHDPCEGTPVVGVVPHPCHSPVPLLSLRYSGIGPNLDLLDQTGCRLAEFAGSLGLPFEFKAVEGRIGEIRDDGVDEGLWRIRRWGRRRFWGGLWRRCINIRRCTTR
ncbi:hypothetical protein Drorol1_Dr00008450 [Drosera rotundifolia]